MTSLFRYFLAAIVLLNFSACSVFKSESTKVYPLMITNPSAIERADELVVLTRESLEANMGKLKHDGYISVTSSQHEAIPVQFDDLDGDGSWDEAVFLHTFKPKEKVEFTIGRTKLPAPTNQRAHVRMRVKNAENSFGPLLDSFSVPGNTAPTDFTKTKLPSYLTEGPAWENDKVAFRIYMDTRNTKDIYGKRTSAMMMDTVGTRPENSYHNLSPWGMDILAVGKSLGAGSLAMLVPLSNGHDTLVRLGGTNIGKITYKKIDDGPLRATFQMKYHNWQIVSGALPVDVVEEISIWGGKYYYQSKVTITNPPAGARLVTGIVNLKTKKSNELNGAGCNVLYTYDVQSENKDKLGMALLIKQGELEKFDATPNVNSDVMNTYTAILPLNNQPVSFRFVAGWEMSDLVFVNEENFKRYLQFEAEKYSHPLTIKF